jgi:hypothetical protein
MRLSGIVNQGKTGTVVFTLEHDNKTQYGVEETIEKIKSKEEKRQPENVSIQHFETYMRFCNE